MTDQPTNAHEERARAYKVGAVVKVIADAAVPIKVIVGLGDDGWSILAKAAHVHELSATSRQLVLDVLNR